MAKTQIDGFGFTSKPSAATMLSTYGLRSYKLLGYPGSGGVASNPVPSQATVDALIQSQGITSAIEYVVLDEEPPGWDGDNHLDKMIELAQRFKSSPNWPAGTKLGYYGVFPPTSHFGPLDFPSGSTWDSWLAGLEHAAALEPHIDFIAPSLYTYYRNADDVEQRIRVVVRTLRDYTDKPIYPFVTHGMHEGGDLPPAAIAGISNSNPARVTIQNVGGEPGPKMQTGDYVYIGRHNNAPTYSHIAGMTEIEHVCAMAQRVDDDNWDLLGVDSTSYGVWTQYGILSVMCPLDQHLRTLDTIEEIADGIIHWGGFLQHWNTVTACPYFRVILDWIRDAASRVLVLNGTSVVASIFCSPRNIRHVVQNLGGDGWCFADLGSAVAAKVAGNTITGTAHGSSLKFYPNPA